MLKVEEADEVKKNDWCIAELQENDMTTAKTETRKSDLQATQAELESAIKTLEDDLASAANQISELQVNLQRANEDRQKENLDFQPTVAQKEYAPNKGAQGVMQMIEKLVGEAKEMTAEATKAEVEAQAAYEAIVADTNGSVLALQKEIATKTQTKAQTHKDLAMTESDIVSTVDELEGL